MQISVKRQRLLNIVLLGVIVAGGFIAAVRPAVDANFDKITCNGWHLVDGDGKKRITARTDLGSNSRPCAGISWFDKSGAERISASKCFLALARHAGKAKSYQFSEASKRDVAELRARAA